MKKLIEYSVKDFVFETDSASPAPGGGSVSALAGSLGIALARMVGHLTIPKKKFHKLDESIQEQIIDFHDKVKKTEVRLLELIDEDTNAFNAIMKAFKMPKDTDGEKAARKERIEQATLKAIEVPETIAGLSFGILKEMTLLKDYGNKNALSDVGVSALMLYASIEGAILNVKINLPGISDDTLKQDLTQKVTTILAEAKQLSDQLLKSVHDSL